MAEQNRQETPTSIQRERELGPRAQGGFLPFYTNAFDRVFISVVILIGIHLLWLRFIEPQTAVEIAKGVRPVELATLLSFLIGFFVVRYG